MSGVGRRRLWLIRHAEAEPASPGQSDFDRDLSPKGQRQCRALGRWLVERIGEDLPTILVSPALRTRETARLALAGRLPAGGPGIATEPRIWEARPEELLALINEYAGPLLLIGHNPGLEQAQFALTGLLQPMGTGAAFELELRDGDARLVERFQASSEAT